MKTGWLAGLAVLMLGFAALWPHSAQAAPVNALGISPALQNLNTGPEQDSISYVATFVNNTAKPLQVQVAAQDFTAAGQYGSLEFLTQPSAVHGLTAALSFSKPEFTVPAFSSQAETVSITKATQLAAGGHYAAVLFRAGSIGTAAQVQFKQTVASLVFLTTSGRGNYSLQLEPVRQTFAVWRFPTSSNLVFQNTGSVQTTPRGYLTLQQPLSQQATKAIVNPNSAFVLPGSQRLLQTPLLSIGHIHWPGAYTIRIFYHSDASTAVVTKTIHFYYVGPVGLLLVTLLGAGAIAGVRIIRRHRAKPAAKPQAS